MLIAAFGDIHGNLPAFEAALAAIDDAGIQTVVNTGDCVAGGAWPNEVIDLVRARRIPTAQGLMDRYVAHVLHNPESVRRKAPEAFDSIQWTRAHLHGANLEFLKRLHRVVSMTVEGISLVVTHGSAGHQDSPLEEHEDRNRFRRERERTEAQLFVCGQTHRPFARWVDGTLFVNPGAVNPTGPETAAHYAVISTEQEPWTVEFRQAAFDR